MDQQDVLYLISFLFILVSSIRIQDVIVAKSIHSFFADVSLFTDGND